MEWERGVGEFAGVAFEVRRSDFKIRGKRLRHDVGWEARVTLQWGGVEVEAVTTELHLTQEDAERALVTMLREFTSAGG